MQPGHVPFADTRFQSWGQVSQQLSCTPVPMFSAGSDTSEGSPPAAGHDLSPSKVLKGSMSPPSSMSASACAAEQDTATQVQAMLNAAVGLGTESEAAGGNSVPKASSDDSSDSDDLCGPHAKCEGGKVRHGVYYPCNKRLGNPRVFQHLRAQVCFSQHRFFKCATCENVVHSGCWVRTAKDGSFVLPSALTPFHCHDCACKKHQEQCMSLTSVAQATAAEETTKIVIRNRRG
jgi:hypothetical protein